MGGKLISMPFLAMAAWSCTLGWLSYENQYQLFLAPKFGFLIHISMVLSLIFALGLGRTKVRAGQDHLIKGMILLLPILFIFSAGDRTLGNFALSKRTIMPLETDSVQGTAPVQGTNPKPLKSVEPEPAPTASTESPDFPLVSISDLVRDWAAYDGKPVSLEGLFSETVSDQEGLSAVFRYFITCCAADAMPVGVFIPIQKGGEFKNDDWVRISGKIRADKINQYDVMYMELEQIEKREKPSKNAAYMF